MGRGRSIFWAVVYFTDLSMCAKFQGLSQRLHLFTHSWPPALTSAMPYLLEPQSLSLTLCGVLWTLPHVSSVTQESSTMAWLKSALTVIRRARRSIKLWSAGTVLRMLIMRYKLQKDFLRLLICYDMLIYMMSRAYSEKISFITFFHFSPIFSPMLLDYDTQQPCQCQVFLLFRLHRNG